jgi:hypothetical protein
LIAFLFVIYAAAAPWFVDDLIPNRARSEISDQIHSEELQGNMVIDGELICDGPCVDRYPFFIKVSVQEAAWLIPFWGVPYRIE